MAVVVYPSSLPGPSTVSMQPSERRLLSDLPGLQSARGVQRDYCAREQIEWSLLDATAAAALEVWWRTTLTQGGAWFAATWPHTTGWGSVVRRFIGAPKWQYLAGGFWRVTAEVEVRGRGLPPDGNRDPFWSKVVLLARLNGADNGTTFVDLTGRHTLTAAGNAKTTTGLAVLGETTALQTTADTDYVSVLGNLGDFVFAARPCTFEIFGDLQAGASPRGLMGSSVGASTGWEWTLYGGVMTMLEHDAMLASIGATRPGGLTTLNQYSHYAFTFDGTEGYCHFDGVYVAGVRTNTPLYNATSAVRIGMAPNGPYAWPGRLQEVRVTMDVARYPRADIVVPTEHFAQHA